MRSDRYSRKRRYRVRPRFYVFTAVFVSLIFLAAFLILQAVLPKDHGVHVGAPAFKTEQGLSYEQGLRVMLAAKKYINTPGLTYDASYFVDGYPPKKIGVCTDVIWNGLAAVGVDFKSLVDSDIDRHFDRYSAVISVKDPNIDFRYVPVLRTYLDAHAIRLTTDPSNLLAWQPGDIVIFQDEHTAMVSCLRNLLGYPYVIQHGKDPAGDEDRLYNDSGLVLTGHYRWPQTITF